MEIIFEKGDKNHPVGHGFIYFTDIDGSQKISASYIIFFPIDVQIEKYIPPFLSGQIEGLSSDNTQSFIFPPSPEEVESVDWINSLADLRNDDVVFGGATKLNDVSIMMIEVKNCMDKYVDLYKSSINIESNTTQEIDYVVYGMMSEQDLLSELTILLGRFRYAIEGNDKITIKETGKKISSIGKYLPENMKIDLLLISAQEKDESGSILAQLYLERAYSLHKEDYNRVKVLEDKIKGSL